MKFPMTILVAFLAVVAFTSLTPADEDATAPSTEELMEMLPPAPWFLKRTEIKVTRVRLHPGNWECRVQWRWAYSLFGVPMPLDRYIIQVICVDRRPKPR